MHRGVIGTRSRKHTAILCRQDQNRCLHSTPTQCAEHLDSVPPRKHQIKYHQIEDLCVGAEETFWLAARSARAAVAAALAELVAEGAFTEARALELARMYLHDNAAKLYGDGQ